MSDALQKELDELRDQYEDLKAKSMTSGAFSMTEWCQKNQDEGRGPCGACAGCCKTLREEMDDLHAQLAEAYRVRPRVTQALNNLLELGEDLKGCKPWKAKLATLWGKDSEGNPVIVKEQVLDIADIVALTEGDKDTGR